MTPEGVLQREIMIAASCAGHRLLRFNVGLGWVGEPVRKSPTEITLRNYRPFKAGTPGVSDLIGITRTGKFAAIEAKIRPRKATKEQLAFGAMIQAWGGVFTVAYSVEEALSCLNGDFGADGA